MVKFSKYIDNDSVTAVHFSASQHVVKEVSVDLTSVAAAIGAGRLLDNCCGHCDGCIGCWGGAAIAKAVIS